MTFFATDLSETSRPRRWLWGLAVLLCAGLVLGQPAPVLAQQVTKPELQSLLNKIERLQREMTTLQKQVYQGANSGANSGGGAPVVASPTDPNLAAAMQVRLDEIETQMRGFTGKIEELNHAIEGINGRIEKLVSDLEFRIKALEGGGGASSSAPATPRLTAAPAKPGVIGTVPLKDLKKDGAAGKAAQPQASAAQAAAAVLPKGPPEKQYKHATGLLFQTDYAGAEKALAAFVAVHPGHKLAGNAQYWLGETHYVRGNFRSAAQVFAEGYQKYPKSAKGADNLLKLGMSLAALGKKKSACVTFKRLRREFPKAAQQIKNRADKQHKKLRCR